MTKKRYNKKIEKHTRHIYQAVSVGGLFHGFAHEFVEIIEEVIRRHDGKDFRIIKTRRVSGCEDMSNNEISRMLERRVNDQIRSVPKWKRSGLPIQHWQTETIKEEEIKNYKE